MSSVIDRPVPVPSPVDPVVTKDGIVNLAAGGMLVVSAAQRLGSECPLPTYCAAHFEGAGAKRRADSAKLTMP